MDNADMPAMAQSGFCGIDGDKWTSEEIGGAGLTKREYFAGLAMQGILAHDTSDSHAVVAEHSVEFADALLDALDK